MCAIVLVLDTSLLIIPPSFQGHGSGGGRGRALRRATWWDWFKKNAESWWDWFEKKAKARGISPAVMAWIREVVQGSGSGVQGSGLEVECLG